MARPRKNPPKDAAPAAAPGGFTPPVPGVPAANPFAFTPQAAPGVPAPAGFPPAPAVAQGFAPQPAAAGSPFAGFGATANPAPAAFTAATAAHPTSNPAAATVDLSEVNKKLDALASAVAALAKAQAAGFKTLEGNLSQLALTAPTPAAPAAPSAPAAPAAPAQQDSPAAQAGGFDPSQVAAMVHGIRSYAGQHYSTGGTAINVNQPNVATYLVQAAIQTGVPYLAGQDPSNPQVQEHVLTSLQQAGGLDADGNVLP